MHSDHSDSSLNARYLLAAPLGAITPPGDPEAGDIVSPMYKIKKLRFWVVKRLRLTPASQVPWAAEATTASQPLGC